MQRWNAISECVARQYAPNFRGQTSTRHDKVRGTLEKLSTRVAKNSPRAVRGDWFTIELPPRRTGRRARSTLCAQRRCFPLQAPCLLQLNAGCSILDPGPWILDLGYITRRAVVPAHFS